MTKRRNILIMLACLVLGGLLTLLFRAGEPRYHGRSLPRWLDTLSWARVSDDADEEAMACEAIRHFGTNAFPTLLKYIQDEPPPLPRLYLMVMSRLPDALVPHSIQHRTLIRDQRADAAVWAFHVLGPEAYPVIPDLVRLINNSTNGRVAWKAAQGLCRMGQQGLWPLVAVATNQQKRFRVTCIGVLGSMTTNAAPALPALILCLHDNDEKVAREAAWALSIWASRRT